FFDKKSFFQHFRNLKDIILFFLTKNRLKTT
ncbi:MAG: hypothetical protein ACI9LN_001794, partial [Saprospiraceae bacterium]